MADQAETAALREILRQGERQLADQKETRESLLRRAGELVRLGIALLGAMVVVGGIMSARGMKVDGWMLGGLAVGVVMVMAALAALSALLAGVGRSGLVANGPHVRKLISQWSEQRIAEHDLLDSLAVAMPSWVEDNDANLADLRRAMAWALLVMAAGTILLLVTLLYIIGGTIRA